MLWFLVGCFIFLFLQLFVLPFTPIWLGSGQTIYLLNATRMLSGEVIYRDFFQFTTPGTELVYVVLFKLFGVRAWIPNALLIAMGMGMAWLTVTISKAVVPGANAYLASLLFLVSAYTVPFSLNGNHHWFSALAATAAVVAILPARSAARLAGAAGLCGLTYDFTQARGVVTLLGIAAWLFWEARRYGRGWGRAASEVVLLIAAFAATLFLTNGYFIWKAGLGRYWDSTIIFGVKYYPAEWASNSWRTYMASWPELPGLSDVPIFAAWLFIHALLPLVYVVFLFRYRRKVKAHPSEPWDRLMLLAFVGVALFIGVAPAPNWPRLCAVSIPALILLVWLLSKSGGLHRAVTRSLWMITLIFALVGSWLQQRHWRADLDGPVGRMAILDSGVYESYRWFRDRTRPGDFFFSALWPDPYFPLGLRNPTEVPFLTPTDYTRPEQARSVVAALQQRQVRFVLWSIWLDLPDDQHPEGDHLAPVRKYLWARYHLVRDFPGSDLWERNQ